MYQFICPKTKVANKNIQEAGNKFTTLIENYMALKEIRDTFEEFQNSENDVLAYYAKYSDAKYQQTTSISTKQPIDWCFEEWHTWLRLELTPRIDREFNGKVKMWYWTYQGRYASTGAYFGDLVFGKHEPVIEFFFRNGETITANVHVETLGVSNDSWDRANITEAFWQAFSQHFGNGEFPSFKRLNQALHCQNEGADNKG